MTSGRDPSVPNWPEPLAQFAYVGCLGEYVQQIAPLIEASPEAVYFQSVALAASALGPGPHVRAGRAKHRLAFYVVVVGRSSRARKGTSLAHAVDPVRTAASEEWLEYGLRNAGGLASGEGLLANLAVGADGDEGRFSNANICCLEREFAKVLRVAKRDGNILSPCLRTLWDDGEARSMTRASPITVRDAKLTVIGHITRDELLGEFSATEVHNGMGNRVLWVAARRQRLIPHDDPAVDGHVEEASRALKSAISRGSALGRLDWSRLAYELFETVYDQVERSPGPGAASALTARASPQIVRLAGTLAALDVQSDRQRPVIRVDHLLAATELFRYCGDTVNHLWGGVGFCADAERVHAALRAANGALTRSQLSASLQRNWEAARISAALEQLKTRGLVVESRDAGTGGAPATVIQLTEVSAQQLLRRPWKDAVDCALEHARRLGPDDEGLARSGSRQRGLFV